MERTVKINIQCTEAELEVLQQYHNRATNTLEPQLWPDWVKTLDGILCVMLGEGVGRYLTPTVSIEVVEEEG